MLDINTVEKHMEVVGSDGQHVGTVDCTGIKLTKNDPAAHDQHHFLKTEMLGSISNGKVMLTVPAAQAIAEQKVVEN